MKNSKIVKKMFLPTKVMEAILFPPQNMEKIPKKIRVQIVEFLKNFIYGSDIFSRSNWKYELDLFKAHLITGNWRKDSNKHLWKRNVKSKEELRKMYPEKVPFKPLRPIRKDMSTGRIQFRRNYLT